MKDLSGGSEWSGDNVDDSRAGKPTRRTQQRQQTAALFFGPSLPIPDPTQLRTCVVCVCEVGIHRAGGGLVVMA